ncbi:MAG TPA: hypothetical protein VKZ77_00570 [Bacillaceae bacterium]|nr:hypothetical protein [Bacillaceae bacterium]
MGHVDVATGCGEFSRRNPSMLTYRRKGSKSASRYALELDNEKRKAVGDDGRLRSQHPVVTPS